MIDNTTSSFIAPQFAINQIVNRYDTIITIKSLIDVSRQNVLSI